MRRFFKNAALVGFAVVVLGAEGGLCSSNLVEFQFRCTATCMDGKIPFEKTGHYAGAASNDAAQKFKTEFPDCRSITCSLSP